MYSRLRAKQGVWTLFLLILANLTFIYVYTSENVARKPLNILFVVGGFPVLSETFILNQIIGLLDRGCNVYIYSEMRGDVGIAHKDYYAYELHKRTIYKNEKNALKRAASMSFDIVVCHFGQYGYTGYKLIKKCGFKSKFCTFFHGYDMSALLQQDATMYNKLFDVLDVALPISDYWKQKLLYLGCNPDKIVVHHMGIDCMKFQFRERVLKPNETVKLLSVARLVEKKGLLYSIQAFSRVVQVYENIEYTIVGGGPQCEKLQTMVNELGLQEKVKLVLAQSQDRVAQLLDASHIFIAPSITASNGDQEGIPVAVMEAMAVGMPVISTLHSGIPELVEDGVSGLLAHEKDVDELTEKILFLITHPQTWLTMGLAGRRKVEQQFDIHTLNDLLMHHFSCITERA